MEENKKNILFKNVDLIIAYLVIFAAGLIVVYCMTNYINSKVKEFTDSSVQTSQNK